MINDIPNYNINNNNKNLFLIVVGGYLIILKTQIITNLANQIFLDQITSPGLIDINVAVSTTKKTYGELLGFTDLHECMSNYNRRRSSTYVSVLLITFVAELLHDARQDVFRVWLGRARRRSRWLPIVWSAGFPGMFAASTTTGLTTQSR